ncbi:High mobility group protein B3 [Pleurostoma richardsiae]|uniref:High mobility group protein B3 n=1 Tax=Pleurostoma richardsiae TaxID=41990 RepID=A0AA38VMN8_9PEZI|nr:High mobility group protein B3 [Pleurostoma richardsiae]
MSPSLEEVFGELGISQYLGAFLDQGFDTWETILDITESDLDALGVKLGHRRKLQRRIANSRGVAPDTALVSPTQPSIEDARPEHRPDAPSAESRDPAAAVIQKRKYRRHPKPDENAPERPPSAYVLFSNKMRDDLKGRNLTFTEIAKLVGEHWQSLTAAEKEVYETQAQTAKSKYNQQLAEYKKTPEHRKYAQYLQEFKAKHAHQSQEKDASKRVKLSDSKRADQSSTPSRTVRSGTVGSQSGSEPPPTRQQRIGSTVSNSESQYAASTASGSQLTPREDPLNSPSIKGYFDPRAGEPSPGASGSPHEVSSLPPRHPPSRRNSSWLDGPRAEPAMPPRHLPSFSDMFDNRAPINGVHHSDVGGFNPFQRSHQSGSPASAPSVNSAGSKPPSLRKEQSSAGSISSASSYSYPRTPIDGPLPIHALLTGGKPVSGHDAAVANSIHEGNLSSPDDRTPFPPFAPERTSSDPAMNYPLPHLNGYFSVPPPMPGRPVTVGPSPGLSGPYSHGRMVPLASKTDADLDGMSALLRAGEIVDRRAE